MPQSPTTPEVDHPTLGYFTRRQPPGTGEMPGSEWTGDPELAVSG